MIGLRPSIRTALLGIYMSEGASGMAQVSRKVENVIGPQRGSGDSSIHRRAHRRAHTRLDEVTPPYDGHHPDAA
jgi:hypothetical protein